MDYSHRRDIVTSQHIEIALVYQEMLGTQAAEDYLRKEKIPGTIVDRVLSTSQRRWDPAAKRSNTGAFPFPGCRRKNRLQAAIVDAAISVASRQGPRWARTLLDDEHIPVEVTARVLGEQSHDIRGKPVIG
jgi:hypothetical protein